MEGGEEYIHMCPCSCLGLIELEDVNCRGGGGGAIEKGERMTERTMSHLWVVPRGHPFIAEDASELEDALKAADHHAFEVQLRCDAQRVVAPQRVMVGHKRPCIRAAGDGLENWCLHLGGGGGGRRAGFF